MKVREGDVRRVYLSGLTYDLVLVRWWTISRRAWYSARPRYSIMKESQRSSHINLPSSLPPCSRRYSSE